jgi:predicted hydrocarbon binding protein
VAEGNGGLILDKQQFPLTLSSGHRAMFMTAEAFQGMLGQIRKVFSTGGKLIIYEEGLASGKGNANQILSVFGYEFTVSHVGELIYLYSINGMGRPEIVMMDIDQKKAIIRLYDNIECLNIKSEKPFSEYIRGHICGIGNVLFKVETKCIETKCIAVGNEFCEFEIRAARENS